MDKKVVKLSTKDNISFYLFVSPWIVGFLCFTLIPLAASLYFSMNSLTKLSLAMGNPMKFVGLEHYADIFTKTPEFATALKNTLFMPWCACSAAQSFPIFSPSCSTERCGAERYSERSSTSRPSYRWSAAPSYGRRFSTKVFPFSTIYFRSCTCPK